MTLKKYHYYRLAIVILLAAGISSLVATGNYLLPLAAVALAWLILYNLRQHVDGVLADECDYALAGQAARYSISAFSVLLVIAFFVLMHFAQGNQDLYNFASILSYLACFLLLLNAIIFQSLRMRLQLKAAKPNRQTRWRSILLYIFIALFLAGITASTLRLVSGEDDWICDQGQWVKHGQPSAPMPSGSCKK